MSDSVMRKRWQTLKALDPEVTSGRRKKLDLGPGLDKATAAAEAWQKKEREATAALEQCKRLWSEAEESAKQYRKAIDAQDVADQVGNFEAQLRRIASGFGNLVEMRKKYVATFTKVRT